MLVKEMSVKVDSNESEMQECIACKKLILKSILDENGLCPDCKRLSTNSGNEEI